jgi:hypothetical protein
MRIAILQTNRVPANVLLSVVSKKITVIKSGINATIAFKGDSSPFFLK